MFWKRQVIAFSSSLSAPIRANPSAVGPAKENSRLKK